MEQGNNTYLTSETVEETSIVPNVAQAADPSIVTDAENALRCFEGEPLDREQAERLLAMWSRRDELSDDEWSAVLNRFPVDVNPSAADGFEAIDDETMDLLYRLKERLKATANPLVYELGVREGTRRAQVAADEQAYANGYVDALTAVLDPEPLVMRYSDDGSTGMTDHERAVEYRDYLRERLTRHAWIVRAGEVPGYFHWTCACGETVLQEPGEPDIGARLRAHITPGENS